MTVRPRKHSGRRAKDRSSAFENVKNQLAYCGLWCGSCLVGNGTVNELALECRKALTNYGVNEWGPKGVDYKELLKGLAAIASMEPCRGCLRGGGRTNCEIRACAIKKELPECVDCGMQEECQNSRLIHHMRSGASRVGMKVSDKPGNRAKVLEKWIAEMDRL